MTREIEFTKMHGCGNNYIYVWLPENPITDLKRAAMEWSRKDFSIGSDGLITIDRSSVADFRMRIFNSDGSEAMMCGNGVRCCAKFVKDKGLTDKQVVSFETLSGIKVIELFENEKGEVVNARVDMGEPALQNKVQLRTEDGAMLNGEIAQMVDGEECTFRGTFVCMGNPHFVIFVDDMERVELEKVGRLLEHNEMFPERCNIEFAQLLENGNIRMRVWERGSGITLACGTGACATSVAATLTGRTGRINCIVMDGGTLQIEWGKDNHVYMTGPARTAFEGRIRIAE